MCIDKGFTIADKFYTEIGKMIAYMFPAISSIGSSQTQCQCQLVYTLSIHCSVHCAYTVVEPSVPLVYPLYTISVRPVYTSYTELWSGSSQTVTVIGLTVHPPHLGRIISQEAIPLLRKSAKAGVISSCKPDKHVCYTCTL